MTDYDGRWTLAELDFLHAHVGLGELWQASDRRREVAATLAARPVADDDTEANR